jgi:hypothetical protein
MEGLYRIGVLAHGNYVPLCKLSAMMLHFNLQLTGRYI